MVKIIFFSLLVFIQWFGTQLLEKLIRFLVFFFSKLDIVNFQE